MRQLLFCGMQFVCALINTCHDLSLFCWKGGELPKRLKFEEHVLEQKLVKHVYNMLLDITYAHPNVFISNSACEKTQ